MQEFGKQLQIDVRIYDEIKDHENQKFISIKINYESDTMTPETDLIGERTSTVIYARIPEGTVQGQAVYSIWSPSRIQTGGLVFK